MLTTDNCCQNIKSPLGVHTRLCIHEENFHDWGCNRCSGCCFAFAVIFPVNGWMLQPQRETSVRLFLACVQEFLYISVFTLQQPIWPHPNRLTGFLWDLSLTSVLIMASCLTVVAAIWCETVAWPVGFTAPSTGKWTVWARADSQNGCCVYRQLAGFCSLGNVCVWCLEKKNP